MTTSEEIKADIETVQETVTALNVGMDAVVAKVSDLQGQVAALSAQVAAGGVVSQADLDAFHASLASIVDVASQAKAKEDAVVAA